MRCREAQPLISAFHDGELGRSEQEAVRTHLMDCRACRGRAAELRSISRWLEPEAVPAMSEGFTDGVMARLRAGEGLDGRAFGDGHDFGSDRLAWVNLRWLAIAAALILTAGSLFLAMPNSSFNSGRGTLDAAFANDVDKEIERNNVAARAAWTPHVASKPVAKRSK